MTLFLRTGLAGAAFAALVLTGTPALSETVNLKASLNGAAEVPPNLSKGTASVAATYDTASRKLAWKGTVSGLSGNPTAAHFHGPAEPGKNAGVAIPITSISSGEATLTDAQAADLLAGMWYVNIHTSANPAGEIRGQVTK